MHLAKFVFLILGQNQNKHVKLLCFFLAWGVRETALPEADRKTVRAASAAASNYPKLAGLEAGRPLQKQARGEEALRLSLRSEILEEGNNVCVTNIYIFRVKSPPLPRVSF